MDWQALISKTLPAPFIPGRCAPLDKSLVVTLLFVILEPRPPLTDTNMDKNPESKEAQQESFLLLRRNSIQKLFNGYEYDIEQ